ncbi:MAG: response regulator [Gammaproteobacteria bacterium]
MVNKSLSKIAYAEDEDDIRAVVQIALEDIGGFAVKYFSTGRQLLEMDKEFKPDLLLLDVMMPEMDGPAALKELRKREEFANIPAIFMTAKIQPGELEEYKKMGVLGVISKPFDPMTLADDIKKIWNKYYG